MDAEVATISSEQPMSFTWGTETLEGTKRHLILIRRTLTPFAAIIPRSDIQYWIMIFVMLVASALLLATLLDKSPIF
jgi:hypothetical protein